MTSHVVITIDWQGITLSVGWTPRYFGSVDISHLTVEAIRPKRARLPITDTGYRSHFIHASEVEVEGGPAAFVLTWLDHDAQSAEWRGYIEQSRQMSLF